MTPMMGGRKYGVLVLSICLCLGMVSLGSCSTTNPRRATDNACSALFLASVHPSALIPLFMSCTFGADAVLNDQNEEEEDDEEDDDEEEE